MVTPCLLACEDLLGPQAHAPTAPAPYLSGCRLAGVETVPSVGLPAEYFNTPSKWVAYAFLAMASLLVGGWFMPHGGGAWPLA